MKDISFLKTSLIAHRGVHISNPENSMNAFKEAMKKNYIIELDIHLLKDNTIVVFHDDNLKRMTGINKRLKDTTYEEIKRIKLLNTNNFIPKFEDVLKMVNGKVPIVVELKYDRMVGFLEREVVKILDNYKGSFVVKSFNPLSVFCFRINRPNYIRGLLLSQNRTNLKEILCRSSLSFLISKPDFISCDYRLCLDKKILKYKKKMPVITWTISNKKNYYKYKDEFYNLIIDFKKTN